MNTENFVGKDSLLYQVYDHLYLENFGTESIVVLVEGDDVAKREVLLAVLRFSDQMKDVTHVLGVQIASSFSITCSFGFVTVMAVIFALLTTFTVFVFLMLRMEIRRKIMGNAKADIMRALRLVKSDGTDKRKNARYHPNRQ